MNHLHRELAPISDSAWAEIDEEAARCLKGFLSGRRLADFVGPLGWDTASVNTGRTEPLAESVGDGVEASARRSQPLIELCSTFVLDRSELDALDRGAPDADLAPAAEAAKAVALAEDRLFFEGNTAAGIVGVAAGSPHPAIEIPDDYSEFPRLVARAVATLQDAGVEGPYAVALGPTCHTGVVEGTERGGYPVLEHLRMITGGPLVRARAVDGTVVLSLRGGDFELISGQDLSIGYVAHDADTVTLRLEESLTFRNLGPEAAVALRYPD